MAWRRAVVSGRVQGVGFRHFVWALAQSMQVEGEVWNREDGAVELYFGHEDEAMAEAFAQRLHDGPGTVSSVQVAPIAAPAATQGFRIGATRP